MSQKDVDEFVVKLAYAHPKYSVQEFKADFQAALSRNPSLGEINNFLKYVKEEISSPILSKKVYAIYELKMRCVNPTNTGKGVSWLNELPNLLDTLFSAHTPLLNSTDTSSPEYKDCEEIVKTVLEILVLLGYSFRLEHSGLLQNKVEEIDGYNRLLTFFWAACKEEMKNETVQILAFFYHNRILPPSSRVIIPVLVRKFNVCVSKVSATPGLFPSFRLLLAAIKCLSHTTNSATLLVDGNILPAAVTLLGNPTLPIAKTAADLLGQVAFYVASSAVHVQKMLQGNVLGAAVKFVDAMWERNENMLNSVSLLQALLEGGQVAVDAAVEMGVVAQCLHILGEYARGGGEGGSTHGIENADVMGYLVGCLLRISYTGLRSKPTHTEQAQTPPPEQQRNMYAKVFAKNNGLAVLLALYDRAVAVGTETVTGGLEEMRRLVPLCVGCLLKGVRPHPTAVYGPILSALKQSRAWDIEVVDVGETGDWNASTVAGVATTVGENNITPKKRNGSVTENETGGGIATPSKTQTLSSSVSVRRGSAGGNENATAITTGSGTSTRNATSTPPAGKGKAMFGVGGIATLSSPSSSPPPPPLPSSSSTQIGEYGYGQEQRHAAEAYEWTQIWEGVPEAEAVVAKWERKKKKKKKKEEEEEENLE